MTDELSIGGAADAAASILESAAAGGWRGSDPYDGLWWNWPHILKGGRRRRQAVMQLHARAPVDIRRLRRAEPPLIPKALGIFGSTGARLRRLTGEPRFGDLAVDALTLLDGDHVAGPAGWGYHWDMQTRWSFYPGGSPNVVVTFFASRGLQDAVEELGAEHFGRRAQSAAQWTLDELYLDDEGIFAYHPGSRVLIHNANLLGARMVHTLAGDPGVRPQLARAVERTLDGQRPDGSWPYGKGGNLGFVDSFHTGYVLDCLCSLRELDPAVDDAVARGAEYYVDRFFDADGTAHLWPDRKYPIDAHSAGTGLTALATLVRHGHADRGPLEAVMRRTVTDVVRGGHAVFRRYAWGPTRVNYIRWCDAHVALGLTNAALALAEGPQTRAAVEASANHR